MTKTTRWTIRQLFLWTFVSALVLSHLATFYQSRIVGFENFEISYHEPRKWLNDLDSTSNFKSAGGFSGRNGDSVNSDSDFLIETESATSMEIVEHLHKCILEKSQSEGWHIDSRGTGNDSFEISMRKGATQFRLYCWSTPPKPEVYSLDHKGKNYTQIKLIQVGYRYRWRVVS